MDVECEKCLNIIAIVFYSYVLIYITADRSSRLHFAVLLEKKSSALGRE